MAVDTTLERRLVLFLLAGMTIRLAALWLNATDLFFDEAQYWSWAQEPAFGYYSKPPMIAWVIAATTAVCGDGEPCVRAASPILHTATAWIIFLVGRHLYDVRVGFWSALVYATLPGVSVSTSLISTDVPFLFLWALALWAFLRLRHTDQASDALVLGLAIGLGFLARYSMAFFVGSMLIALWVDRQGGQRIGSGRWLLVAAAALLAIAPNLYWNFAHGFATFGHTADNAKWAGSLLNPLKALEFVGAQFGVFGPILFGALLVIGWRVVRGRSGVLQRADRLLLAFALPILLVYVGQALVSRAHANWAAAGYIAATLLVTATMLREPAARLFRMSLGLHVTLAVVIAVMPALATWLPVPADRNPYRRLLGWHEMADLVRQELTKGAGEGQAYAALVIDDRGTLAEMLYYLRDLETPIEAWKNGPHPKDHFELTRPFSGATPALFVGGEGRPEAILRRFASVDVRLVPEGGEGRPNWRPLSLYRLDGYKGAP